MSTLKSLIVVAVLGYLGLVALMYFTQRVLMYFPERSRTPPAQAGFPEAEEIFLDTADGERVIVWSVPPRGDNPVILYFHGNGASLRYRTGRFRMLTAQGFGLVALSYRGYGGSTGSPSEDGLIADGRAAYAFAAASHPAERIVLWGESLGTGVAIAIAAQEKVAALALEAPFTSAAAVGAAAYPFVPVRLLMKDQFRSDERIGRVTAPFLFMHGMRDRVVPFALGERLYALAGEPKRFVRFADGGHEDLDFAAGLKALRDLLAEAKAEPSQSPR
jgi:fermentation-respiration switch protein FrsA (DUF1100 family)